MLGAIADDFTGATDLATNLVTRGFKTTVTIGVPGIDFDTKVDADATVVALKTRTAPVSEAISDSRRAVSWLRGLGATKIYDKYCSTFDSTATGNIGPIAEALMNDLGVDTSIVVPSFPDNERTVYQGHLFVGDQLLSDSSMRNHPLTPMTESNLTRLLSSQTSLPVHLIPLTDVRSSIETIRAHFGRDGLHILDAITTADLQTIASATEDFPLVTGGSGLALGMTGPRRSETARAIDIHTGYRAVLAGSASRTTQRQVAHARTVLPHFKVEIEQLLAAPQETRTRILDWALRCWAEEPMRPVLVYSVDSSADVAKADGISHNPAQLLENTFAELAADVVGAGVRQLIVAGGETSGAVVQNLGIPSLDIGPQIAPGVAWAAGRASSIDINIALKSGNFGTTDMFTSAWERLQ